MAHRAADSTLAVALIPPPVAIFAGAGAFLSLAGLLLASTHSRQIQYIAADARRAQAVANYLNVVAPVEQSGSQFQLIGLLSAVHTLAASPGWRRGFQVAWGNAPLLQDRIGLVPLDSLTRKTLAAGGPPVSVPRAGHTVVLVPLLDRELNNSIGWVATWDTLPPSEPSPLTLPLLVAAGVLVGLVVLLPPARLSSWSRAWLVLAAVGCVVAVVMLEAARDHRLRQKSDGIVDVKIERLVERAGTMPRVKAKEVSRIWPDSAIQAKEEASEVEVLRRAVAIGIGGFVLSLGLAGWARQRVRVAEKTEYSEDNTPLRS